MAKMFVKLDNNLNIIGGYTDFFGCQPADGDIEVMDSPDIIHFMINGEINPPLFDDDGYPLYKYVNGKIVENIIVDTSDITDIAST